MATINPDLYGFATGRIAKNPAVFDNADGSHSVRFTLMVRNNFKNAEGKYDSQGIDFQAFVPSTTDGLGVYGLLKKGMLVQVGFEPRANNYTDKDKVKHYEQVLRVTDVRLRESKATTDARGNADEAPADEAPADEAPVAEPIADTVSIDELL